MMHALVFDVFGGPEVLSYREVPAPALLPGTALNYHLEGKPPWILGYEGAGTVVAVAEGDEANVKLGARVAFADVPCANAEIVRAPLDKLVPLPEGVSFETAAAVILQGLTAQYLVRDSHALAAGELAVVHASGGGVGLLLTQLARRAGARDAGAFATASYDEDWPALVRGSSPNGRGADVVFDSVGSTLQRSLDAARFGRTDTRQQIILAVTQNFYGLLRASDLVKVSQAQVTRAQQTVSQTQGQIDAGVAARADILQSQADLANAQVSLLQNESAVRSSEAALKNVMAVETDAPLQPATLAAGDALPPAPDAGPERTLADYVRQAYAARPDLRQQLSVIEVSRQSVKQAHIAAGPAVSGSYVLTFQPVNDLGAKSTNSQVLVTASYPLFDAGGARGAVRVAEAGRDADLDRLEQLRQSVRLDVEQSYYDRSLALQRTQLSQVAVQAAQASFDAATARRAAGIGTVLDITTAQVSLTQAQNGYVSAVYDFYTADARLRRATGQNDVNVR